MALSLPARRSLALPAPRHHRCRPRFATVPAPRRRPSPLHRAAPPPAAVPDKSSPPSPHRAGAPRLSTAPPPSPLRRIGLQVSADSTEHDELNTKSSKRGPSPSCSGRPDLGGAEASPWAW
uniref:Uncharacterized protein n=1 Tax=Oryza nivara TaxID=4536 RepID=A0A0E0GNU4_ORYNI